MIHLEEFQYDETFAIAGRVRNRAQELEVDLIVVDAISWGKGVADTLAGWGLPVMKLNVGETAADKERFENLRAELWWKMAEYFNSRECAVFDMDLRDRFAIEVCAPKYGYTPTTGKIYIEKKASMLTRGIKSTNLADCIMHCFSVDSVPRSMIECKSAHSFCCLTLDRRSMICYW